MNRTPSTPRQWVLSVLAIAALVLGAAMTPTPATAAGTGTLAGTVTVRGSGGSAGVPLAVQAYAYSDADDEWYRAAGVWTDAAGAFSIDLPAGTYRLRVGNLRFGYDRTWFDTGTSVWKAADVVVPDGGSVNVAPTVVRLAGITGRVAGPVPDAYSYFYARVRAVERSTGRVFRSDTYFGSDGRYGIYGLPAGTYSVAFDRESGYSIYAAEYYADKSETTPVASTTPVVVTAGQHTPSIDAGLVVGGTVSGRIVDATGAPYSGYCSIAAFTTDGTRVQREGNTYFSLGTQEQGRFTVRGLSGGPYRVGVQCDDDFDSMLYYAGGGSASATTDLTAGGTGTVSAAPGAAVNIGDLRVPVGGTGSGAYGTVSGTITRPVGDTSTRLDRAVQLIPTGSTNGYQQYVTARAATGEYTFGYVRPGTYRVQFARVSGEALAAAQFYQGRAETAGEASSTTVTVAAGAAVTGVDATLVEGRHHTGRLVDGTATPIAGCRVVARSVDGTLVTRSDLTGADGSFDIGGLAAGSYKVSVERVSGTYAYDPDTRDYVRAKCGGAAQYAQGAPDGLLTEDAAAAVTFGPGAPADLGTLFYRASSIAGSVTLPAGVTFADLQPGDLRVRLVDEAGVTVRMVDLAPDLTYRFDGLPSQRTYRVLISGRGSPGKLLAGQWYQGVGEGGGFANATPIQVGTYQQVVLDPVAMKVGAVITGVIQAPDGTPVESCRVVVATMDDVPVGRAVSGPDGTFRITGVAQAMLPTYVLRAGDCGYDTQYRTASATLPNLGPRSAAALYAIQVGTINLATPLRFTATGEIRVDVDLPEGVSRYGSVAVVDTTDGRVVRERYYNEDRPLRIRDLVPGSYRLEFNRSSTQTVYAAGYALDRRETQRSTAQTIAVQSGQATAVGTQHVRVGGTFTGVVKQSDGTGIAYCQMVAFNDDAGVERAGRGGYTRSTGTFTLRGLDAAAYYLAVQCDEGSWRYYDGDASLTADPTKKLTVTASDANVVLGTLYYSDVVAPGAIENTVSPVVTGRAVVGAVLSASTGSWSPSAVSLTYQWLVGGLPVLGATGSTYKVRLEDVGRTVSVRVTASRTGYTSGIAIASAAAPAAVGQACAAAIAGDNLAKAAALKAAAKVKSLAKKLAKAKKAKKKAAVKKLKKQLSAAKKAAARANAASAAASAAVGTTCR